MTNLYSILKGEDITLLTKLHIVKDMVFPVAMYECESWTIKKILYSSAECWRIDAFKLWCWRRLLRASWTTRRSNQSILKEVSSKYSLEGLLLKLQYFEPSDVNSQLIGKDPDAETNLRQEKKGMRGWDGWMASLTQWTWVWGNSGRWRRTGKPGLLQTMGSQRIGHNWAPEQQQQSCVF